ASFAPRPFPPRGDLLDPWCKPAATPLNVATCGEDDLRALAIERLRAFDNARSRLSWEQQKALAADQNGWALSVAQACGLKPNVAPELPLDPALKACLARAGKERLGY